MADSPSYTNPAQVAQQGISQFSGQMHSLGMQQQQQNYQEQSKQLHPEVEDALRAFMAARAKGKVIDGGTAALYAQLARDGHLPPGSAAAFINGQPDAAPPPQDAPVGAPPVGAPAPQQAAPQLGGYEALWGTPATQAQAPSAPQPQQSAQPEYADVPSDTPSPTAPGRGPMMSSPLEQTGQARAETRASLGYNRPWSQDDVRALSPIFQSSIRQDKQTASDAQLDKKLTSAERIAGNNNVAKKERLGDVMGAKKELANNAEQGRNDRDKARNATRIEAAQIYARAKMAVSGPDAANLKFQQHMQEIMAKHDGAAAQQAVKLFADGIKAMNAEVTGLTEASQKSMTGQMLEETKQRIEELKTKIAASEKLYAKAKADAASLPAGPSLQTSPIPLTK